MAANQAAADLAGGGTTIEGFAAVGFGHELAERAVAAGSLPVGSLPLLAALRDILHAEAPPLESLWAAVTG